jgi:hypothetical protein
MPLRQTLKKGISLLQKADKGPVLGLLCMAALFAVFSTYLANGFVWLDHGDIQDGRAILTFSHLLNAFVKPFAATGFYRPLVTLVHSCDAAVWKSWAPGFHCTNLLLHLIAALSAPLFLGCFFPLSRLERWATVLVFAVHPIAFLPAGCISFRSESLMALFTFLSLWSYCKARKAPLGFGWKWLPAVFLSAMFACLSKETTFFYIPAFIVIWEIMQAASSGGIWNVINGWSAICAVFCALAGVFFLRLHALPRIWRIESMHLKPLEGITTRFSVLGMHFVNLLSPFHLRISDAVGTGFVENLDPIAIVIVVAVLVGLGINRRMISTPAIAMLFLVLVALFPALNFLPLPRFYSPHYAYLAVAPTAGLTVIFSRALRRAFPSLIAALVPILWIFWLLAAAASTALSGPRLKSDLTLFQPEVKKDPRFLEAQFYLGNYYSEKGELDSAWKAYENGLKSGRKFIAFVDRSGVLINQSAIALRRADYPSADSVLLLALTCCAPDLRPDISYDRAYIADRRGDYNAVVTILNENEQNLQRPEACLVLTRALLHLGRQKDAEEIYNRYLSLAASHDRK